MKIKSGQVYTEKYIYTLDTTVQQFWFSKGRPGGVLELVFLALYNPTVNAIGKPYILLKHKGETLRLYYWSTLAAKDIRQIYYPVYLDDGNEMGFEMYSTVNGDLVEVAAQWIWHADKD